jgi:propionyl-CoA synthetase
MVAYRDAYQRSLEDREGFWLDAAEAIDWAQAPTRALDDSAAPIYRWFPDARLNLSYNALDRHIEAGRGDDDALIYDSPVTDTIRMYSFRELRDEVALAAGMLRAMGVGAGDRVLIYASMTPESVIAMLACARLGAVHSVVFGGFGARELALRIDDSRPVVVVSSSCGIQPGGVVPYQPMLSAALAEAIHKPARCVWVQRPQHRAELVPGRDIEWDDAMSAAAPVASVDIAATDPLYILYTSGTAGRPKGVVRDGGGYAVALQWSMTNVFDTRAGEVFWAASDVGWVVGHSYIVYGPLLAGVTTVLYEGKPVGTPDAGAFWRVAAQHRVTTMFAAPTALRAIRKEDPDGRMIGYHDLSHLGAFFLAGERLDPETYSWASSRLGIPIVDNWWQTETGWPIAASPRGLEQLPTKAGSASVPMPGYDVTILDETGNAVPASQDGSIAIRLPLPPGCLPTLWHNDSGYVESYLADFPGFYATGDGGHFDDDGYLFVMGRTDDVLNVAGHRLSCGSIEEVVARHPAVAECAVIGVADPIKGQIPHAFVVLKADAAVDDAELEREIVAMVRDQVGPVAALKTVKVLPALPKTRSGKILRRTMRGLAEGREEPIPPTIEDATVIDAIRQPLRAAVDVV